MKTKNAPVTIEKMNESLPSLFVFKSVNQPSCRLDTLTQIKNLEIANT